MPNARGATGETGGLTVEHKCFWCHRPMGRMGYCSIDCRFEAWLNMPVPSRKAVFVDWSSVRAVPDPRTPTQ